VESSDLTCLQVFNAITAAMQNKQFARDMPFNIFIEEYIRARKSPPRDPEHAER
jgi:hypothetical protein